MPEVIERLAKEAASLNATDFADFLQRLTEERLRRGLPLELEEALSRQEDLLLSQQVLTEDWEGTPDDWEADPCPSRAAP